jgi:peptidoglycan hydrolase CwlO-like protein
MDDTISPEDLAKLRAKREQFDADLAAARLVPTQRQPTVEWYTRMRATIDDLTDMVLALQARQAEDHATIAELKERLDKAGGYVAKIKRRLDRAAELARDQAQLLQKIDNHLKGASNVKR